MMAYPPNSTANHSGPLPYLRCLVSGVSMEIQQQLRFITNSVFRPLDMTLAVMSFLSNCILLIAVARIKPRAHPSLMLVCSLSMSDLAWATVTLYKGIRKVSHPHLCPPARGEDSYLSRAYFFVTLSNLAFMSKDRFRAVRSPRWYFNHVIKSRVLKEAFTSWPLGITAVLFILVCFTFLPKKAEFIKKVIRLIFYVTSSFFIIYLLY